MFLLYGAVGDALGFLVESGINKRIEEFIDWYDPKSKEEFKKGEYSDDTQLTLAVARSIWDGEFHPEYFSYVELPLWVYYRRGAGKATTKAAMNLFSSRIQWYGNFYPGYENAGGSGAATRVSPIVAAFDNEEDIVRYVIYSSIITHGNSKALVGAIITASTMYSAKNKSIDKNFIISNFKAFYNIAKELFQNDETLIEWERNYPRNFTEDFGSTYTNTIEKAMLIDKTDGYPTVCKKAGEYDSPGLGTSVSLCAFGLALKLDDVSAKELLLTSANERGTDADTIAAILGSTIGFYMKEDDDLAEMAKDIQDYNYLLNMQSKLLSKKFKGRTINRQEVRNYALELEKALKASKLPEIPHPVFGKLTVLEERGKIFKVGSQEGQTLFIKHQ